LPSSLCGNRRRRTAIKRRVYSIARRRIKGGTIVYQERQRKVFYILFTIFIIVYIIILAFIGATFKFIGIMATVLLKGLLGILGLFYNNSKGARKGEESKQPIKL
jgi:Na+/H+-translocating membrane pyrophosphatase